MFCFSLVKFACQESSCNWRLATVKQRTTDWPSNSGKWCQTAALNSVFTIDPGIEIEVFSFSLMWFEKFGCQGYLPNWKFAIVKQGKRDWPEKTRRWRHTTNSNECFAIALWVQIERFLISIWCNLRRLSASFYNVKYF